MADAQRSIDILTVHRANLLETKTFEEYRDAHVAYIDMLIEQIECDAKKDDAVQRWVVRTEKPAASPLPDLGGQS